MATNNHFDRWSRIKWFFMNDALSLSLVYLLYYCWTIKVAVIKLDLFFTIITINCAMSHSQTPLSLFSLPTKQTQNKPIPFISSIRFDLALMGNVKMTHSTRLVRCKITSSLHQIPLKYTTRNWALDKNKTTSHREYKNHNETNS